MIRRTGDRNQFWDNAAVGAGGTSAAVELPRSVEQLALYITVSGATTISLEAAHSGDLNADGTLADANAGNWGQVYMIVDPVQIQFTAAGSAVLLVPDFVPGWIRLRSSGAATITAGWEATSG